jgi:hypothetical protein
MFLVIAMDTSKERVLIDWILQLHRLGVPARPSRLREMADHIRRARATEELPPWANLGHSFCRPTS